MFSKFACLVVDAYSTGKNIALLIKGHGYPCIHIKSSTNLPLRYKHNESDFILNLVYDNNLDMILHLLKPYKIKFCIPGYESGVELADLLCEKLNVVGNGTQFSQARRDKYIMNETVTKAGLKTVKHYQSDHLPFLISWAKELNNFPVVAKPSDSANGDGVFFCHDEKQIEDAYKHIISSKNQLGVQNKSVLLETLNIGEEFIINTVSWEGQHFVAEIWRVTRKLSTTIYEKAELLNFSEEEWLPLTNYTCKVLDALRIQYGAGTTEVKYTKELGATLLETSSRLMGNAPLAFSHDLAGFTQLSLLIEAYLTPHDFLDRFNRKRIPAKNHGVAVVLISDCEGLLYQRFGEAFHALETLHSYNIQDQPDATLSKTVNSLTAPGEVYLVGSRDDLKRDYDEIRKLESTLYRKAITQPLYLQPSIFFPTNKSEIPEGKKYYHLKSEAEPGSYLNT